MSVGPGSTWLRYLVLSLAIAAVVAIVALMATPGPSDENGLDPDERSVVTALRSIVVAQRAAREALILDVDGDGRGEHAFLGELSGCARMRLDQEGRLGSSYLSPPLLGLPFAAFADGSVPIDTFLVQLHLPASSGGWVADADEGGGSGNRTDTDRCEETFCVYAWPTAASRRRHAFFTDETGVVRACDNKDLGYFGRDRPPAAEAALARDSAEKEDERRTGRDGRTWYVVR